MELIIREDLTNKELLQGMQYCFEQYCNANAQCRFASRNTVRALNEVDELNYEYYADYEEEQYEYSKYWESRYHEFEKILANRLK